MFRLRQLFLTALFAGAAWCCDVSLPDKPDAVRFAVIGDSGTGTPQQYELGKLMADCRKPFPFQFVIMNGDNLYGAQAPRDFKKKFEEPYKTLLDGGVKFYASLGNHDDPVQRSYGGFDMGGKRFYSFEPKNGIKFYALDSNYMDKEELDWLTKELAGSKEPWKIAFFHHPLYSSGAKHGSDVPLRSILEPLFVQSGVSVVFSGHDHFYERIKPQRGIQYFVCGSSGKVRTDNIRPHTDLTAKGFDTDLTFMLVEISGDEMFFQTLSRTGQTIDSGSVHREGSVKEHSTAQ